jgi:NTP pyrophosphatase (non-canonical NTP hydrolase)
MEVRKGIYTFDDYQDRTPATAVYPKEKAIEYLALGLASEAGEVAGVVKKFIRGDTTQHDFELKILDELGDTLWYLSQLHNELDYRMNVTAEENIKKLRDRQQRDTLKGSGDDR